MSRQNQDARADAEVEQLRSKWPEEWATGARTGFEGESDGASYPQGFHTWPLDRRNAWFAGFVRGYLDRLSIEES